MCQMHDRVLEVGLKRRCGKVLWTIGDGNMVRLGFNPWVANSSSGIPKLKSEYKMIATNKVSSLFNDSNGYRDEVLI